ncbi:lysophospholipase catalytic domain-containing protein [Gaertneriomyces semiglobifer]|nr:lysophospholipase catalytic domain-containing protein [Gaertneriomyces semiglobifer]
MPVNWSIVLAFLVTSSLLGTAKALPVLRYRQITPRSLAPSFVDCPSGAIIRTGDVVGPDEQAWVSAREQATNSSWTDYLSRINLSNVTFMDNRPPKVAIAVSGGGFRAMLFGASILNALDARNDTAVNDIKTGGVLQTSTYIAGLSGGSWLLASLYLNSFPNINTGTMFPIWNLETNLLQPAGTGITNLAGNIRQYSDIADQVDDKHDEGFNVTITDFWSRLLSIHLTQDASIPDDRFTALWSSLASAPSFANHSVPFPLITYTQRTFGEARVTVQANLWESSFFETGSPNAPVRSYLPTQLLGTFMDDGTPQHPPVEDDDGKGSRQICSSRTIFTTKSWISLFLIGETQMPKTAEIHQEGRDTAIIPNPFHNFASVNRSISESLTVELVDGGEAGQNMPLFHLIQEARDIDTIIALDASNDNGGFPNATSLVISWKNIPDRFPPVPATPEAIVTQGLNTKIVAFGCAGLANNGGGNDTYRGPMIVYIPNFNASGISTNTSTFQTSYTLNEVEGFFTNGIAVMRNPNGTSTDVSFAECFGCMLVAPMWRNNPNASDIPQNCKTCLQAHCWDGSSTGNPDGDVGTPATRNYNGTGPAPVIT